MTKLTVDDFYLIVKISNHLRAEGLEWLSMEAFVARNSTLFKTGIKESARCGACDSQDVDLVVHGSLLFLATSLSQVLYKQSPLLCAFMLLPSSLSKMLLTFPSPNMSVW